MNAGMSVVSEATGIKKKQGKPVESRMVEELTAQVERLALENAALRNDIGMSRALAENNIALGAKAEEAENRYTKMQAIVDTYRKMEKELRHPWFLADNEEAREYFHSPAASVSHSVFRIGVLVASVGLAGLLAGIASRPIQKQYIPVQQAPAYEKTIRYEVLQASDQLNAFWQEHKQHLRWNKALQDEYRGIQNLAKDPSLTPLPESANYGERNAYVLGKIASLHERAQSIVGKRK